MLEEVSHPLGILAICFPAWNGLERLGMAQQQLPLPFEHVPDTLPRDACPLHGHRLTCLTFEPVAQTEQIREHRRERLDLLVNCLRAADEPTGHDHLLVHVHPTIALRDDLHRFLQANLSSSQ
jgi:hypothetical protein